MFSFNKSLLILITLAYANAKRSFYDYTIQYADGYKPNTDGADENTDLNALKLESLKGKVVLVVNVASKCGYTDSDYKFLTELHNELAPSGQFEILAFPCNQFGGQEPWQEEEIVMFARNEYGANFPIMKKVDVKGENVNNLWDFLQEESGVIPSWNFFKHLISDKGELLATFPTGSDEDEVRNAVIQAMFGDYQRKTEL